MRGDLDDSRPTWDEHVRAFLLDPVSTPFLILSVLLVINVMLVYSQGGLDGMRDIMKRNTLAREERKRQEDMERAFSRPGWPPYRSGAEDDNYAK